MYAISYAPDYFVLREVETKKEAKEFLEFNVLDLYYQTVFSKMPVNVILKNKELSAFFDREVKLTKMLKKHHSLEKLKQGYFPLIVTVPKEVSDCIAISHYLKKNKKEYSLNELKTLLKMGFADSLDFKYKNLRGNLKV